MQIIRIRDSEKSAMYARGRTSSLLPFIFRGPSWKFSSSCFCFFLDIVSAFCYAYYMSSSVVSNLVIFLAFTRNKPPVPLKGLSKESLFGHHVFTLFLFVLPPLIPIPTAAVCDATNAVWIDRSRLHKILANR